jgi:tubulin monoglycylase TTLL3/8
LWLKKYWIVKPSGLSRGRGISCIDQLNDILTNIKPHNQIVIQKYIENPLIIKGRKFDIRQWVLVTNFNPLTVYLFDTPYIRFGAEEFHLDDFKNIFSQLTGNSIAKHSEKFENSEIEGDMWEIEQFRVYLKERFGKDCWPEIQEKIKKIVIYALQSAKHKIIHRKNSHEVFGFDIMIDELLNVFLIEINLSPDWTYSTKVTEKLVKIASEDMMKVVLDTAEENLKPVKERKEVDTGRFKLIYSSSKFPEFDKPYVNKNYCS